MTAVFRHEMQLLFSGLTAYVYGAFCLFFVGVYMMYYNLSTAYANFEYALAGASFAFILMIPIITMRIIAEEKKQKTDQLLYSLPITTTQIVVGKFLAVFLTSVIPMCLVIAYPLILKNYGNIPQVKCYPNMLNQVFMNILVNACQSIKDKGTITISTELVDKMLVVKIKDTGSGIDDKIKDKMFSVGATTKKIGTGLGLAISQKIVEKHKGKISFESEKGKGTEFKIEIPAVD